MSVQLNQSLSSSYFPSVQGAESYLSKINAARNACAALEGYETKDAPALHQLVKEWTQESAATRETITTSTDQMAALNSKVDQYIQYRNIREHLFKMASDLDAAIADCTPPRLDPQTLTVLTRLEIDVEQLQNNYNEIFTTQRNALIQLKNRVATLSQTIVPQVATLGSLLEKRASTDLGYTWFSYMATLAYTFPTHPSTKPIVNQMVEKRENQLKALRRASETSPPAEQPVKTDPSESKEADPNQKAGLTQRKPIKLQIKKEKA